MSRDRRRRKSIFDRIFGDSFFEEVEKAFDQIEAESGYSIRVIQDSSGTHVYAKVGKNTDVASLRRQLKQRYPGAEIHIEGGKPLIREIATKPVEPEKEKKKEAWFKPE